MVISKSQTNVISSSSACTVSEYRFLSQHVSFATAHVHGRHPDSGSVVNMECEEVYYVVSGSGVIHSEFGSFEISTGDVYHFQIGEKFWVEGDNLELVLVNAPAWRSDQHKNID